MGSITHIVNGEGAVQNHYEYDAWGNVTEQTETVPNRFKFNGQQLDPITQQYYLRARFYNPVIARFTQEDTYRGDGLNLYAYCANNPVVYEDPTGNACEPKTNILKKAKGLATFTDNSGKPFKQDANGRWHDASGRFTSDPTGVNQPKKPQAKLPTDKAGQLHGNNLDTDKPAAGYTLIDRKTGEIKKYGETTSPIPERRYSQAYYDKHSVYMQKETIGTKREMHTWQHEKISEYKSANSENRPKLNFNDY